MIFRPDIKPPMWGPPDAVRYAVMANAERMGIDPSCIKLVAPFWEGAGSIIYDASLQNDISTTSPLWVPSGYRCSTTNKFSPNKTLATLLGSITSPFTLLTFADIFSRPTSSNFFLGQYQDGGSGYDLGFYQSSSSRIISYYYKSGSNVQLSPGVVESGASISLGITWDGASITGYFGGALASTAAHSSALATTHTFKAGGVWAGGNGTFDHKFLIVCSSALTACQIGCLTATPCALIMPVSRPVYFDLGAGGGTALNILQALQSSIATDQITLADLSAGIATTGTHSHDLSAALATSGTVSNDLSSLVSTSGAGSQDLQASIATSATLQQALQAAIATEIQTSADLLLTVSELVGTVVSQDLRLSIATAQTGHADLQTSIATLAEIHQGLQLAVATSLTTLHDTSIQIAELVGSIVRQDLCLTVATELQQAQAVALSVASEASTVQDTLVACTLVGVSVLPELFEAVCPVSTEFTAVCPVSTEFTAVCPVGLRS